MCVRMDRPEPDSRVVVRTEVLIDGAQVCELLSCAFADLTLREGIGRLREGPYFKRELSLVADDGGRLLGCAFLCPAILQGAGRAFKATVLLPVAALDGLGRDGVGERLARHSIQRAACLGYEVVLAMGPARYFSTMGLTKAETLGIETPPPAQGGGALVFLARPELAGAAQGRMLLPPGLFTSRGLG